jgi:putative endonuclease
MLNITRSGLGVKGETLAVDFLQRKGFILIARNYHSAYGEIDIVMQDNIELVFIEVKTRSRQNLKSAENSITLKKRMKLTKTAQVFLHEHPELSELSCRFDIMIIFHHNHDDTYKLLHYQNAFEPIYTDG